MIELQRWLYGSATAGLKSFAAGPEPAVLLAGLAFAVLFGSVHALMPGHGKVALVSYYLGRPSRMIGGVVTSVVLILTHVGSAIVLVLAGWTVMRATLGGVGRAPVFEAASAILVTAIGSPSSWSCGTTMRRPTALPSGQSRRASVSLTSATASVPSRSERVKARPALIGIASASK